MRWVKFVRIFICYPQTAMHHNGANQGVTKAAGFKTPTPY